ALKATEGLRPGSKTEMDAETLDAIADMVPGVVLTRDQVVGQTAVDVMALAGIQKSKSEAKRAIQNGGARINNIKIEDVELVVDETKLLDGRMLLLGSGKKNKMLVRIE
ncbi:hypothetical protein CYMTET_31268, partial [Cymbomonas tetramitiformis]